ncbi:MAG: hypothetical protein KF846_18455 [Cyclobacteriaceae bacterium]|nr:hypothetical protein [Cyclobacteriaceae bacterium]
MRNYNIEFDQLNVKELQQSDLVNIQGGGWLQDIAYGVGYAVGFVAHGVIDAVLIITGNYQPHTAGEHK